MFIAYLLIFMIAVKITTAEDVTNHPNWKLLEHETCGISLGAFSTDRIVGGVNASLGAYPWIARLGYKNSSSSAQISFRCGGVLISHFYVITAAHCTVNLPDGFVLKIIRLGEHNTLTNPDCEDDECADPIMDYKVAKIISHKKYGKPAYKNDIALVRLKKNVTFTDYITPICMIQGDLLTKNLTGEKGEVAGWGFYDINKPKASTILQTVKLPIVDIKRCLKVYKVLLPDVDIDDRQLCVGGDIGKDSCGGDSGGPMMKVHTAENSDPLYYLLGIVSFGVKHCGQSGEPGIYTAMSKYLEWILDNLSP